MAAPYDSGMTIDHIAIPSGNIPETVDFYVKNFGAQVLFQDPTWAFLKFANVKLALVTPTQHPAHVAFAVTQDAIAESARAHNKPVDHHRDGTRGIYINDPAGNAVELIAYPPGETAYAKK